MNYLNATIEKIENASTEKELNDIDHVVNYPAVPWTPSEKAILNRRIADVRAFWKTLAERDDIGQRYFESFHP